MRNIRNNAPASPLHNGRGWGWVFILLLFGIGARAGNVVTIGSASGVPGEEVTVSVSLANTDVVSSLQVSIPLDKDLTLVDGSGQLSGRCDNHSLTIGVKDGVLNIFVYSLSMSAITGTEGEVALFKLLLGNQPKTVSLAPSKVVLTNTTGGSLTCSSVKGSVVTLCAKAQYGSMTVDFGRVPIRGTYTKTLTVKNVGNADLVITGLSFSDVNVFRSTTSFPLTIKAGTTSQMNITYSPVKRGSIERTLKVECNSISKLNTITLKAEPYAVNELRVQPVSGVADEEVDIRMTMNNMDAISGYQVEFQMPNELEYVDGSFTLSDRKADHVTVSSLNDGILRIIVYSPTDIPLTGNDGEIGSFKVKLSGRNNVTLKPSKCVLSATIDNMVENVMSAVYGATITIKSPRISAASNLDMGAVSVTDVAEKAFSIRNSGNAPLTINRIVFDNENLSVKETMPIVISQGGSSSVTVAYGSTEQKSFSGTMQIYSNDPEQRLWNVNVTGSRFAPNYFDISAANIYTDDNLSVDIDVNTYDDITGLQFDLIYPNQYYEPFDGNYTLETRATGMTVTYRQIDENTLRFFCYFLSGNGISAGEGKVMSILLKPIAENVPVGNYSVSVKNIKLGTSEMADKYAGTDTQCSFSVEERGMKGDANKDGKVNIQDVVAVINIMAGKTGNYDLKAADANQDNRINIVDVTAIINIMAGKH